MKKSIKYLFAAAILAITLVSCEDEEPVVIDNHYMLDDVKYEIDSVMFWYQSGMGGDPYIRLITNVAEQANPDLLKLYPNMGLSTLPGTYTWDGDEAPADTYDVGYTANYQGMQYDWTAIGKTGSEDLVIAEDEPGVYHVTGTMILSVGSYDFSTGDFTETGTKDLTIDYTGAITPL